MLVRFGRAIERVGHPRSLPRLRATVSSSELRLDVRVIWADPKEDEMIIWAPFFLPIFGPLRPTAGRGSLGTDSGSKHIASCTKKQPRRPLLRPIRGYFVFLVPAINDKSEAPQGQPRKAILDT